MGVEFHEAAWEGQALLAAMGIAPTPWLNTTARARTPAAALRSGVARGMPGTRSGLLGKNGFVIGEAMKYTFARVPE